MKCKWCNSDILEAGMFEFEDEELEGYYCKACGSFNTENSIIPNFDKPVEREGNFAAYANE